MCQLLPWQQWRSCCHDDTHSSPIMQDQGLAWCQSSQRECHSFCVFIKDACSQVQVYGWLYVTCVCSVCCMSAVICTGVVVRTNAFTRAGVFLSLCMMCMQHCTSVYVCMNKVRERKTTRERQLTPCGQFSLAGNLIEMTWAMSQAGRSLTATASCSNLGQQLQVVTQHSRVFLCEGQAVLSISY